MDDRYRKYSTPRLWVMWVLGLVWPGSDRWRAIGAEIERRGPAVVKRDGGFPDERR